MADEDPQSTDEVRFLPPDRSLHQKIGNANLDQVLSPQAISAAQQVIVQASDSFHDDSLQEVKKLDAALQSKSIADMTNASFALKAKAGQGGFDLVSLLAKSLNRRCEQLKEDNFTPANLAILNWYIKSLKQLLALKVKGIGGSVGDAILAALQKLDTAVGEASEEIE